MKRTAQDRTAQYQLHMDEEAILLVAATILEQRLQRQGRIHNPIHAGSYLVARCAHLPHEVFGVVFLDTKHYILATEHLFNGTIDGCEVHSRVVAKRALDLNAAAVILFHNHPSGNPEPSDADRQVTERLKQALRLFDIRVLDRLIISGHQHTSLASRGGGHSPAPLAFCSRERLSSYGKQPDFKVGDLKVKLITMAPSQGLAGSLNLDRVRQYGQGRSPQSRNDLMDYSNIDFSQVPVEQVMVDAATELYRAAHKARGAANLRLQNPLANVSVEGFENQIAEATWDELLRHRSAFYILSACSRQLWEKASWAKVEGDVPKWSEKGRDACIAMAAIQDAYSKVQHAAMLLPGSDGQNREVYLSLVTDPKNSIEQEMVNALLVLKRNT